MSSIPESTAPLTNDDRRERIVAILREQDEVGVEELSQRLGVSEVTVRKDLGYLEEQGYLTRVRGGAVFSGRGRLELRFAASTVAPRPFRSRRSCATTKG